VGNLIKLGGNELFGTSGLCGCMYWSLGHVGLCLLEDELLKMGD
jgi:hypothetical protein